MWELVRPRWHALAACRGVDPDMFFPPRSDGAGRGDPYSAARAVCACCPVVGPCRLAGAGEVYGVWGGLSPADRKRARRGRRLGLSA